MTFGRDRDRERTGRGLTFEAALERQVGLKLKIEKRPSFFVTPRLPLSVTSAR
jgi:hypothetical protein